MISRSLLDAHDALVDRENPWQQRARLHQSLWRQRRELPVGIYDDRRRGSRLAPADAAPPRLANYLSPAAKRQVQETVATAPPGAMLSLPRLWDNLLSSQPLCFNLFAPLAEDLPLASDVLRTLWPDVREVKEICFEWSPGRRDEKYTGNLSAFDVFVEYEGERGRSFLGIEVKYHEDLAGPAASDSRSRYPRIARRHGMFRVDALPTLQGGRLNQIWLDHLLALQTRIVDGWDAGTFVLLHPVGNTACARAARRYRDCLTDTDTFDVRSLDDVVAAARLTTTDPWPTDVYERYLDPAPVNDAVSLTTHA